ncbi:Metallo-dependent phosphatase-like protein [Fusarium redolens]|uniref:Metallo-dependent phosphatase-like protein n=1 Tax=Fusarium redolens TaxID=48865 RepID=A0A9P9GRH7_FUSRE|nr:Metallo-dependent phosphatase-like protein [Fusarium redolens]KAH7244150.1 Metallo-dependent phosphatase-like protein [Fusarium redolens]
MSSLIKTKVLILSDTHGLRFEADKSPLAPVDVVIHCGDLTEDSKLESFKETIQLLKELDAPTKIVIAGNHDFSLDDGVFKNKIAEASRVAQEDIEQSIKDEYGDYGEAKRLLIEGDHGIMFLNEGTHEIRLQNGASMKVYASPYTPATGGSTDWGFQYNAAHEFAVPKGLDIVVTHGPPQGLMDTTTEKQRIGCPQLFSAIAKAQPRIHCFGHVHNSWGAKIVSWRPQISENPSHFSDIDNTKSRVIESLPRLKGTKWESPEDSQSRQERSERYKSQRFCVTSCCPGDEDQLAPEETLFVNAALMGSEGLTQYPWLVEIELERCRGGGNSADGNSNQSSVVVLEDDRKIEKRKASNAFGKGGETKKTKLDLKEDSKR